MPQFVRSDSDSSFACFSSEVILTGRRQPKDMARVDIIPLGGVGEIGKNCTVVRQGDDIVVIDAGLGFPDSEMPGVDIIVPDFSYLIENRDLVRGIFLTHGHEDHVGSLRYLLPHLSCPVYATEFTHALIRRKLEEGLSADQMDLRVMPTGTIVEAGSLSVEPLHLTHSISDNCSIAVHTNLGAVFFTSDFKIDLTPVDERHTDLLRLAELGKAGVAVLLSDTTNVEQPGWGPSEATVRKELLRVFQEAPGRIFLTTISSYTHRIQQVFELASLTGKKVAVSGRRIEEVIKACVEVGVMSRTPDAMVRLPDLDNYPENQQVILMSGSQGEPNAALQRLATDVHHRLNVRAGDTVLYSARQIPGNELSISRTVDRLIRKGATIKNDPSLYHASGHAYQDELRMMIRLTNPRYIAPIHGEERHQYTYGEMAVEMGCPETSVFVLEQGDTLSIDEERAWIGETVPVGTVMVERDGTLGVSLRTRDERIAMRRAGLLVVAALVEGGTNELLGPPLVEWRGVSLPPQLMDEVSERIVALIGQLSTSELTDQDNTENAIRSLLEAESPLVPERLPLIALSIGRV